MDAKWQLVCYLVAFILFVLAAVWPALPDRNWRGINLVAAGLAAFTLVFLWTAWEAV